mmetsp:Transcript_46567/g.122267  ORF Transcript_46567/g.122267 Transcript_46567/m.122267 type:complete len:218 (-) Transcript_46567:209-862(-)
MSKRTRFSRPSSPIRAATLCCSTRMRAQPRAPSRACASRAIRGRRRRSGTRRSAGKCCASILMSIASLASPLPSARMATRSVRVAGQEEAWCSSHTITDAQRSSTRGGSRRWWWPRANATRRSCATLMATSSVSRSEASAHRVHNPLACCLMRVCVHSDGERLVNCTALSDGVAEQSTRQVVSERGDRHQGRRGMLTITSAGYRTTAAVWRRRLSLE